MSVKIEPVSTSASFLLEKILVCLTELEVYRARVKHYYDTRKQGDPCVWPKFEPSK